MRTDGANGKIDQVGRGLGSVLVEDAGRDPVRDGERRETAMTRILTGGVVAGIVLFFWGFVAHMLLPLGELGLKSLPTDDGLAAAITKDVREPGLYVLPGWDMSKSQSATEMEAHMAKVAKGPYGFMVLYPNGRDPSMGKHLPIEFGTNVVCAPPRRTPRLPAPPRLPGAGRLRDPRRPAGVPHDPGALLELVRLSDRLHPGPDRRAHRRLAAGRDRPCRHRAGFGQTAAPRVRVIRFASQVFCLSHIKCLSNSAHFRLPIRLELPGHFGLPWGRERLASLRNRC